MLRVAGRLRSSGLIRSQALSIVFNDRRQEEEERSVFGGDSTALRSINHLSGFSPASSIFLKGTRGFQSDQDGHKGKILKEVGSILQRVDAAHFTEILQNQAKNRWNMDQDEFRQLCIESGAAHSPEDADQICEALDRSGVVLRIKNLVYLRPLEVAEILYKALPDTAKEVQERLDQLKIEAAPLLEKKAQIDGQANRTAKVILWTGFAVFTAQMALYCRLTFWELSWDVMEPITYFTSATFAILAYIYCMWHNEEFGILTARKRISSNVQSKKYAEKGLDKSKLDYLLHRINRLEATLPTATPGSRQTEESGQQDAGNLTDPSGLQPVGQHLN